MATILIVDDLSANRMFLATLLRHAGHRLLEAVDGSEALASVHAEHPDLVITDVLMPVMDGFEFVRRLRLDPTTSQIPVIFNTAHYGEREARALALAGGVCDVLTKPAASSDVLRIVDRVLSGASGAETAPEVPPIGKGFSREHLRLVTDKLSEKADDLRRANVRLRALLNIGLELASERDNDALLHSVCEAARDLFGATYVTLGIVDLNDRTLQHLVTSGVEPANWIKAGDAVSGILETVVSERRTVRGNSPGGAAAERLFPPLHPEVRAYVAAPVASPALVYGWFCLVGNEGRVFTEEDEDLVRALSGQIGRVYETGYFFALSQRHAERLEREILDRKKVEATLRHERDRTQRYVDTAEVILLALDVKGRITLVNRYACAVLGRTAEELLGLDWIDTCLPVRLREIARNMLAGVLGGGLLIAENPVLTRSGEERLIEWRNTVLRDEDGRVTGTLSSGTDLTERDRAVEALRAAEERTRFALEAASVGIWDMDYTTGLLRWSRIMESQHGLQPDSFRGSIEAFLACVHPEDRALLSETMAKANRSGVDFSMPYRTIWPDGTVRWLNGSGRFHFGAHGEPVRAVGITLDITERHTLEGQFQQAQKMEAIGRLAGGVAHDFNNLLTAILGYCELLLGDLAEGDPRHADIVEIQKAGTRGAGLTSQLLAFSRKEVIEPKLLDLHAVVAEFRPMLERLIGEDITIVLGLGSEPTPVKADRPQLEQIILNLAVNARDAMPKGGTLTIETANVELDEHYAKSHFSVKPGSFVVLTMTDTGRGMTPETQARLFEPFFTTKEVGKGTGLGLATVHGIVTRSGGSVNAYSELGRGTSFKVYLPRADAAEMKAAALRSVYRPPSGSETVLVVEDVETLRKLVRKMLERMGYTVLVAGNAEEALRLFDENDSIDVLLTDIVMPGASGPELTRRLIERRPDLKVLYMSGYTAATISQHGVLNPGIAFLPKPFTSDTLGQKLREVLDR